MADKIRKRAEENGLTEDDPFAELTRIMGYDETSPRPASEEPADDLTLELERELLGDVSDQTGEDASHRSSGAEVFFWKQPDAPAEPPDTSTDPRDIAEEPLGYAPEPVPDDVPAVSNELDQSLGTQQTDEHDFALHGHELIVDDGQPEEPAFDIASISAVPQNHDQAYEEAPEPDYPDFPAEEPPHADHFVERGLEYEAAPEEEDGEISFDYSRAAAERHELLTVEDLETGLEDELAAALHAQPATGEHISPTDVAPAHEEWQPDPIEEAQGEPDVARNTDGFAPEVETVDVPEKAVALTDHLDIPDVPYKEEQPTAQFDEIEEILAGAFGDTMTHAEQGSDAWPDDASSEVPESSASTGEEERGEYHFAIPETAAAGGAAAAAFDSQAFADRDQGTAYHGGSNAAHDEWEPRHHAQLTPEPGIAPPVDGGPSRLRSRLLMAGAVVGGVAILGGVTVFALSFGDGDGGGPVVVAADPSPVKVRPEEPGGVQIPNQDNQVYRRVSGEETDGEPEQARLISGTEEPVDLTPPGQSASRSEPVEQQPAASSGEDGVALAPLPTDVSQAGAPAAGSGEAVLPGVDLGGSLRPGSDGNDAEVPKIEDRLASTSPDEADNIDDVISLTPHKVRSLVVRSDGTMVPNEVPDPEAPADSEGQASETASESPPAAMPERGPIPPSRPANLAAVQPQPQTPTNTPSQQPPRQQAQQPAAQPAQTAAAVPPVAPSAPSAWSVQIASQPSAEGAQQSYQDLARRYGNLLQGKGVNIVKADISGRGTFYRVRIPSASKDEAVQLCSQLKAAGGNCFVSQ